MSVTRVADFLVEDASDSYYYLHQVCFIVAFFQDMPDESFHRLFELRKINFS